MAIKTQIQEKLEDGSMQIIHPETDVEIIITNDNKQFISKDEKDKLSGIENGANKNIINGVKFNGNILTPDENGIITIVASTEGGGGTATGLEYNATTGVISLIDKDGNTLDSVDLPLELLVESGSYNSSTKKLELVLANGGKIEIPVQDLIDEYNADGTTITMGANNTFSIAQAVMTRISNAENKASSNESAITNITNGTTKVKKAESADKLSGNKTLTISGDASGSVETDFSTSTTLNIELTKTGVDAGTYSVVNVDDKGRVLAGGQVLEVGIDGQTTPSESLVVGGLFFKKI